MYVIFPGPFVYSGIVGLGPSKHESHEGISDDQQADTAQGLIFGGSEFRRRNPVDETQADRFIHGRRIATFTHANLLGSRRHPRGRDGQ